VKMKRMRAKIRKGKRVRSEKLPVESFLKRETPQLAAFKEDRYICPAR
jgi:hypothetical protein